MPEAILGPVAGAVVGGMMGDSGGGQQTATKEPWAEAAPWLKQNIQTGQNLQQYYQQNPFNQQQQTGYQNLFSDLDHFRSKMAPGLMQFANNAMTGGYQRPQYSKPGTAGYGGATATNQGPGAGLAGLLSMGQQPSANQSYGLVNFKESNPFTAANGIPPPPAPVAPDTSYDAFKKRQQEDAYAQYMEDERRGAGA